MVSLQRGLKSMGAVRTAAALVRLNQRKGFDCPGCAWPEEHGGRKFAEFCENGAKAVAEEATKRVVTPEFFARHSIADLDEQPRVLAVASRAGSPTRWCCAPATTTTSRSTGTRPTALIAERTARRWPAPTRPCSTPPGRTSNEAAFLYQLLVRSFGTNNLPDCSNMCHESSGTALIESIGIGKGSVTVEDVDARRPDRHRRPEPRHQPSRMLSVLEKAKANGAKIIAVNPLPEAGLMRFKDPQKVHGVIGHGDRRSPTSSCRSGSAATWRCSPGWAGCCSRPTTAHPAPSSTATSSTTHCAGFADYEAQTRAVDLDTVLEATGIDARAARAGRRRCSSPPSAPSRAGRWA